MNQSQRNDSQIKILVVDDDIYFRQLLVRILTAAGYHVIDTRSVADALTALEQRPDLAIIDYRMPGNDGACFIKELRENGYKFPIVFCSGSGLDQKTFTSMRNVYQVDMIIQKPIHPEMFVQQIADLMREKLQLVRQAQQVDDEENYQAAINTTQQIESFTEQQQEHESACQIDIERSDQTLEEFLHQINLLPQQQEHTHDLPQHAPAEAPHVAESDKQESESERIIRETEAAIAELGNNYLHELNNEFEQMTLEVRESIDQRAPECLSNSRNRAHQLKGTAGSLGFRDLSQIGTLLEKHLISAEKESINPEDAKWVAIFDLIEQASKWVSAKIEELQAPESDPLVEVLLNSGKVSIDFEPNYNDYVSNEAESRLLPPRVLVVASDRELLSQIEDIFKEEQVALTSLTSSMEAFSVLDDLQPALVMLQETMPSVSGNDLCRMIRCNARWINLPIVILAESKSCSTESRQSLFAAGASDFILTPIAQLDLKAKLKNHLGLTCNEQTTATK
ncbi:hypothetical protein BH11CYA1_BH11CYA1_26100 [soil metagenome]